MSPSTRAGVPYAWCSERFFGRCCATSGTARFNYLVVDFDTAAKLARSFGARFQSTLIVFKGGAERGRAVGETNDRAIAELLDRIV